MTVESLDDLTWARGVLELSKAPREERERVLDEAWDHAETRTVARILERRGLTVPRELQPRALSLAASPIVLPDPRRGGIKATDASSTAPASTGPTVIPTWEVGQPKYPRQNLANWVQQGYAKNEVAFACVRELAQSSSEPRLRVKLSDEPEAPFVDTHPAAAFMRNPSGRTTQSAWISELITLGVVGGNTLAWKERSKGGRVIALRWLRADRVKLIRLGDGTIETYRYQTGTREVDLPADDVVHFPWAFDPLNPGWGLSPFSVLARALSVDNVVTDWQAKFFDNAGVPYGLITTEQLLLDDDADRIADRWSDRYSGLEGWHRPAVLGQGAKYERMGLNMQEMSLDFLRAHDESRICAVFNVPAILAGVKVGLDRSTFANYGEARKSFWSETLRPLYRQIGDLLTLQLAPDFGSSVRFEFDLSDVGALQADEGEKWTRAGEAFTRGWISDNEARSEVGFDPWPVARRMVTISMLPEDAPEPDDQQGSMVTAARSGLEHKRLVPVETGETKGRAPDELLRTLNRSQRSLVPPFETRMRSLYRSIATHVADVVRARTGKAWAGQIKTGTRTWSSLWAQLKALPDLSTLLSDDDRDQLELELRRFRDVVGEQTVELLNGLYPLDATYNPPATYYQRVDEDVQQMWKTLQDRLQELLAYGEEQGWDDSELVNGDDDHSGIIGAIAGTSGDNRAGVHVLTSSVALIALDQYVSHRNDASTLAYRQGGVTFVDVSDGTDFDEACAAADGQRWTLDEAYDNDKEHPNCVRAFVPVFGGD